MTKKSKKTRHETVHVGLLIDESGSMAGMEHSVIGGINEFIEKLRADRSEARVRVSLAMFDAHAHDHVLRPRFEGIPLAEVRALEPGEYAPRGATPLNDAVVGSIRAIDRSLKDGHRAILVVLTDGLENASETSSRKVRELIATKEAEGWEFIYLGAHQDVWAEADQIGLAAAGKNFVLDKSDAGIRSALRVSADRTRSFRDDPVRYKEEQARLAEKIDPDYRSADPPRKRR